MERVALFPSNIFLPRFNLKIAQYSVSKFRLVARGSYRGPSIPLPSLSHPINFPKFIWCFFIRLTKINKLNFTENLYQKFFLNLFRTEFCLVSFWCLFFKICRFFSRFSNPGTQSEPPRNPPFKYPNYWPVNSLLLNKLYSPSQQASNWIDKMEIFFSRKIIFLSQLHFFEV